MAVPLLAIGGALMAGGSLLQAKGQADSLAAQSATVLTEGMAAMRNATMRAADIRDAGAAVQATQIARFAKGGVVVSEGTPQTIQRQTAEDAELAALLELDAGRIALENARIQSKALKGAARTTKFAGLLSAGGQLAGGLA